MSRSCRKCRRSIPTKIVMDGRTRNLQNRKFCLDCSPFGSRNTKSDDPSRPAAKAGPYKDWSDDRKRQHIEYVLKRGRRIKQELVDAKGGGCQICGYDKLLGALSFHHRDPKTKCFGLTMNQCWSKARATLEEEAAKCDLLCVRCHMEVEAGIQ
jgi:hypothetical protein